LTCDWCGGEVRTDGALNAVELMIGPLGTARVGTRIGLHYHSDPADADTCIVKARRALLGAAVDSESEGDEEPQVVDMAELERIPVLDGPADGPATSIAAISQVSARSTHNRILKLALSRRETQADIARWLGTSVGAVCRWQLRAHLSETGQPLGMSEEWAARLAEHFGVTVPFLLGGEI
jgi:hypothetical protein